MWGNFRTEPVTHVTHASICLSLFMDASALKAELKAWERDLKTRHGRPPTLDDIKVDPIGVLLQRLIHPQDLTNHDD